MGQIASMHAECLKVRFRLSRASKPVCQLTAQIETFLAPLRPNLVWTRHGFGDVDVWAVEMDAGKNPSRLTALNI
ncbi:MULTISPECIES: hypothetical protein [unclassified Mesorhizobium]|uniref:hypothetical protein n=1 Tax=unclassified Mesorhizobium TaxID=325217 RepID=UPI000F752943|nr:MULTISPECIES: hypothetical protein [unclassified Mesorhizobium]AZO67211.1 hypothetical protein EJ075_21350 [Mesorhizobium sp. M6A.T.Cr.TU.016.01.1.1]RVB77448.1 hypothetical protein EN885_11895 [Mesorhizobium sp. M6A.T.Cr.TU.014.01.1.1]RWP51779.1 MAG: hypothetical protein EOR06_21970 [Mesorhizobium sp.]RWP71491.1 MAG: hypothetical protein EOR10_29600 [Mesorhizobium sp.]RWQ01932.1 MAG: hypothetical protein EOR90_20140 [Mesorhizobium sp.]